MAPDQDMMVFHGAHEVVCPHCKKLIDVAKGRSDRKFCDERCKNAYHNHRNKEDSEEYKRVLKIVTNNRRILRRLKWIQVTCIVKKEELLQAGFKFDFHTHILERPKKNYSYTFCFDYGYRFLEDGRVMIVRAFEHRTGWL